MTAFNDTFGIIGLSSENVGIDRRIYTGLTSTNPQLNVSYNGGRVDVYLNGVKLMGNHSGQSNYDYTYQSTGAGSAITLSTGVALVATDTIECVGYVSNSSNTVTTYTPSVSAGNNTFTSISHTSSDLLNVFLNGVLLDPSDYTADASADTVAITSLASGDVVHIQVIGALDHSNFVPESGGTFSGDVAINSAKLEVTQPASDQSGGAAIKAIGTAYSTNKAFHAYMNTSNASKSLIYAENSSGGVFNVAGDGNVAFTGNVTHNGNFQTLNDSGTAYGYIGKGDQLVSSANSDDLGLRYTNNLYISEGTTKRLSVESGGNVTVNTGNLVIGTAGQGIDFNATSDGTGSSSISEILSDYEQGQWTPTLKTGGTGTDYFSGYGLNWVRRHYTRIGNVVYLEVNVKDFRSSSLPSSGVITFGNLPFSTSPTGAEWRGCGTGTIVPQYACSVMIDNYSANVINLAYGSTSYVDWADVGSVVSSRISFFAMYHTG